MDDKWFQKDWATPNTANIAPEWLQRRVGDRVISTHMPIQWTSNSPGQTPLDLWGHVKDRAFVDRPQAITHVIQQMDMPTCQRVVQNFQRRVLLSNEGQGRQSEHLI